MRQIKHTAICNREPLVGKPGVILDVAGGEANKLADFLIENNGAIPWPPKTSEAEPIEETEPTDESTQDDSADPSLEDLGITTIKQGRDALEANGIYSLGDYDAMIEAEDKLIDLAGITPAKAKVIEEKIEQYRKVHPETATERPTETATERD